MTPGERHQRRTGWPRRLAWGGTHGDDVGEYSTAAGTTKALSGVLCRSASRGG
jgi:hypothetical protein